MTPRKPLACAAALLLAAVPNAFAGPGAFDASFAPGVQGPVYAEALQPDGRLVIGGSFTSVGGAYRYRIARLWPNGAVDTSFQYNMSGVQSGQVSCLAVQSDGRIVIGGTFTSVNNTSRYGIARLNANGTLDGSFIPASYSYVNALAVQDDNKVIIGGDGQTGYVYRLNADGSMENAFTNYSTGPNGPVYAVALQADGKILVGGSFSMFNGAQRGFLARLDTDGSPDPSFLYGLSGPSGPVRCVRVQPDGKILIGGDFSAVNGVSRSKIARLTSTGSLDPGFTSTPSLSGSSVYAMAIQPDSSVVIGGSFTASFYAPPYAYYSYNIARLFADGSMDTRFTCTNSYYFSPTYAVAVQDDGGVLAGGNFTYLSYYRYLARAYGDLYPPEFILQPTNRSVAVGTNVTLTALVNNPTPTSFQWRKNGGDIPGATGMSYTLNNVQTADSGTYAVSAYNAAGSATTSNAVLNVGITPGITVQPFSVIAPLGEATNISVTATGAPLSYVWIKNGSAPPGATSSVLNFPSLVSTNAGAYYVIVSNFLKSVTSSTATLAVAPALPVITTQPQSQTVAAGSFVTFSVVASNATSYVWRKDGITVSSGPPTHTISSVTTNQAGNYTVVVSGSGGSVTSSVAVLTVIGPPYFTVQPKSANTNVGATVTFSAAVGGTPPFSLQWRKDGVDIPYATLSTFTLANVGVGDSGSYSVYASNAAGGNNSGNAVLNVGFAPIITAHPTSLTVTQGQSASFTVGATGTALNYYWRKDGVNIPGATSATYTIPSAVGSDSGLYSVLVSNFVGTATSQGAALTVLAPVSITAQPASRTVGEGSNTTFAVTVTGTSPAYQWYKNGEKVSGATDSLYSINSVQFSDAADYLVVVSNIFNSVTSQVATLTVQRYPPAITDQPLDQYAPVGGNATFAVGAIGTTLTYQWRKEGTNIFDAVTPELSLTNVTFADVGGYSVIVANSLNSVTSRVAKLTVGYPPVVVERPQSSTNLLCRTVVLSCTVTGTPPMNLQWRFNGAPLAGETNATLTLLNLQATNAGNYSLSAVNAFGGTASPNAQISVFGAGSAAWTVTDPMSSTRKWHTATLLPNGKVLVAGGYNSGGYLSSAELYDPVAGTWTATGALITARNLHTATLLPSGKVLVAGGWGTTGYLSSAELYDPATGTWTATSNSLANARCHHTATLLPNGQVLIAGGRGDISVLSTAELYDPGTETWTTTGRLNVSREYHTATLLPTGAVLVAAGYNGSYLISAELYDPATRTWSMSGVLSVARYLHTATLLPNGKVLVAAGQGTTGYLSSAELYDPATETWTTTGALAAARYYHTATLLPDGKVLVAERGTYSAELYDPAPGTWAATSLMNTGRNCHTATLLPDGQVLVAGGEDSTGSLSGAELYDSSHPTVTVTLGDLAQTYDGTARSALVTTTPPGLPVDVTYNGSVNAPTNAGSYTVIATINDSCYRGGDTNTLVVAPAANILTGATALANGAFQFTFFNRPGASFSVLATTNPALPLSNWTVLGGVAEVAPGQFQFTDLQATNSPQRFYRVSSP